jgi:hypothetical protein
MFASLLSQQLEVILLFSFTQIASYLLASTANDQISVRLKHSKDTRGGRPTGVTGTSSSSAQTQMLGITQHA